MRMWILFTLIELYCDHFVSRLLHRLAVYVFFQAEDGIRYLVRSRGLGDVYKRQRRTQPHGRPGQVDGQHDPVCVSGLRTQFRFVVRPVSYTHLTLPTSDLV